MIINETLSGTINELSDRIYTTYILPTKDLTNTVNPMLLTKEGITKQLNQLVEKNKLTGKVFFLSSKWLDVNTSNARINTTLESVNIQINN